MPPIPQFFDETGTTQQTTEIATGALDAGTTWSRSFQLWNEKGGATATVLRNPRIQVVVRDGGAGHVSGYPITDEKWVRVAATGADKSGDPTMADQVTGLIPIGAGATFLLGDIPRNCARYIDVEIDVPAGAQNLDQGIYLQLIDDESSVVLPFRLGSVAGAGIIPDFRDSSARRLRRGRELSAAGTDVVTVGRGSFTYDREINNVAAVDVALDQDAADGTLAAGQSYAAVLSQSSDTSVTLTKGDRAVAPDTPDLPAGEILLGVVTVGYQAGGTSVITDANIDTTGVTYGEYLVYAATGVNVRVGAGYAITVVDTQPFNNATSTLALIDNATNYVWLRPDGTISGNATGVSPAIGALLLAVVVTLAGSVTEVTDRRPFVVEEFVLQLGLDGAIVTVGDDLDWGVCESEVFLEEVVFELGDAGTGGAGDWTADVNVRPPGTPLSTAGTTLYTSHATPATDYRPTLPANSATPRAIFRDHEVTSFVRGSRFSFDWDAVPAGFATPPADALFTLRFWKK